MLPPVFSLLNVAAVTAFIGTTDPRIYRHGAAPQGVRLPYITYTVRGNPENDLSGDPRIDEVTVDLTCWSDDEKEVELLATACRDTIEPSHHLIAFGAQPRDPDTMRFSIVLTFTIWQDRSED